MTKEPLQPQDKYVLRLPDGMRERIKAAAEKNNRSMNAEIISRLEDSDRTAELLEKAFASIKQLADDASYNVEVLKWMREQQKFSIEILKEIVAVDGKIDDKFLTLLKTLVSTLGKDTGFPERNDK